MQNPDQKVVSPQFTSSFDGEVGSETIKNVATGEHVQDTLPQPPKEESSSQVKTLPPTEDSVNHHTESSQHPLVEGFVEPSKELPKTLDDLTIL